MIMDFAKSAFQDITKKITNASPATQVALPVRIQQIASPAQVDTTGTSLMEGYVQPAPVAVLSATQQMPVITV